MAAFAAAVSLTSDASSSTCRFGRSPPASRERLRICSTCFAGPAISSGVEGSVFAAMLRTVATIRSQGTLGPSPSETPNGIHTAAEPRSGSRPGIGVIPGIRIVSCVCDPPLGVVLVDLGQDVAHVVIDVPIGVVALERLQV